MVSSRSWLSSLLAVSCAPLAALAAPASFSESAAQLSALIGHAPNGSASDVYVHLEAPSSAGWGAIAIGNMMPGSLFFVMYPSADMKGTHVSVRTTSGYVMPTPIAGVEHLVTNSTNMNGRMTADFVCYGCSKWATGSLDVTSPTASWLWAIGPGTAVASDSDAATIQMHSNMGQFTADMSKATIQAPAAGDTAPLLTASSTSTSTGSSGGASSPPSSTKQTKYKYQPMMIVAHAAMLALAFYFFMPVAIMLLRAPPVQRTGAAVKMHYASMGVAWALAIAGMAVAISFSRVDTVPFLREFDSYHQAIGLTAASATIVQAFVGLAAHLVYRRTGSRTLVHWSHMIFGWLIWPLGMLNAPIGFALIYDIEEMFGLDGIMYLHARDGMIAACVVIFVLVVGVSAWGWSFMLKNKKNQVAQQPEKRLGSDSDSPPATTQG